ncbi:unnamed protein product (macronuclear) [Paramecium tetraurelia]|uniref:Uncharacterized protein n=1 Tax=Paramecium tetraurelia TaxID=5888 RepID=A0EH96_PARTE|nr:uncharacterized protein GSPATT00027011001 [Paramecium tetraurelia]CAK94687.1 unnamed protein product [Paramecium tetraurelia]|eukprot:XP_001462060.1 hypothetical protein (macronuclear) [Paramecium tetraurelia strain d4-2]
MIQNCTSYLELTECISYQGVQADCEKFVGNGMSCTNDATATSICKAKDCIKLTADSYSESVCQAYGVQCHNNGTKCDVAQSCSSLKSNLVTCTQYIATDGPCIGTALQTETPISCSPAQCSDAPSTLITNTQCDAYKKGCKTNGYGCASSITCADVQSSSVCAAIKSDDNFICIWTSQCRQIESSCNNFTSSGSSVCTSSKTTSGFGICVWKDSVCTDAKCEDLPLSVNSETNCTAYSATCTFSGTGNGFATKGSCTTYKKKEICANAKSTDKMGSCAWDESVVSGTQIKGYRIKECQDAATTLISDSECNSFIDGCVSNGAGCMKSTFTCDMLKTQFKCLQDSFLRPCLWINNSCSQYYNCTDLLLTTVTACQEVSKYCTSDENKCIPLKIFANYTKQNQCTIGTDDTDCGWVTNTKKCQVFTQCSNLVQNVQPTILNGECSTYADSEVTCTIGGTDGNFSFDKSASTCRLRQCSDGSISTSTHNGCFGYQINAMNQCTTDESKCVPLADC